MSVPTTLEALVEVIRKSGMVDEPTLTDYLQRRQLANVFPPASMRDCADDMIREGVLTNFQAEQFLRGKWHGFTVGKYKLLERVGVGGMGQVFLAEHLYLKRRVALKMLPPTKADQPSALGRFYREARAAATLEHPNIVRTHDIDRDGNLHFIVMDYVDGTNLLDIVKRFGPMDIRRATSYIRQVARALDYACRNKIIHRDVKPGNVLVDRKGVARLLDLGLARFLNDHTDMLTLQYDHKTVLGTADYVAPEQIANSHDVDHRADIYGLGATFYFVLAGHPPFPDGTVRDKLFAHRSQEPKPIHFLRPEVPAGLSAIVTKMLEKDPKRRYQTPGQLVTDLDYWIPATVPLPRPEEMPQLSPAATEIASEASGAIEIAPEPEPAPQQREQQAGGAATPARAAPVRTASKSATWGSQAHTDTARNPAEQTPSESRRSSASFPNPFGAEYAPTSPPAESSPWPLIAAVVAVTATVVAAIAVLMK
jgi:serine/threonine protein kinase